MDILKKQPRNTSVSNIVRVMNVCWERAYAIKKHIYANQVGWCSTESQAKTQDQYWKVTFSSSCSFYFTILTCFVISVSSLLCLFFFIFFLMFPCHWHPFKLFTYVSRWVLCSSAANLSLVLPPVNPIHWPAPDFTYILPNFPCFLDGTFLSFSPCLGLFLHLHLGSV